MNISKKKEDINIDNFKNPGNQVKFQEKIQDKILVKFGKMLQRHVHK